MAPHEAVDGGRTGHRFCGCAAHFTYYRLAYRYTSLLACHRSVPWWASKSPLYKSGYASRPRILPLQRLLHVFVLCQRRRSHVSPQAAFYMALFLGHTPYHRRASQAA